MRLTTRRWWGTVLVATALAMVAALSAHGRGDMQKANGIHTCDDMNEDLSVPQWSSIHCIEGHECVSCEDFIFGEITDPNGDGLAMWMAEAVGCSGERRIGTCVPDQDNEGYHCDTSNYYVDGVCTNWLQKYDFQPQ